MHLKKCAHMLSFWKSSLGLAVAGDYLYDPTLCTDKPRKAKEPRRLWRRSSNLIFLSSIKAVEFPPPPIRELYHMLQGIHTITAAPVDRQRAILSISFRWHVLIGDWFKPELPQDDSSLHPIKEVWRTPADSGMVFGRMMTGVLPHSPALH